LPELLLIGNFHHEKIGTILNDMSDKLLRRGKPFDNGELVNVGGSMSVTVWNAKPAAREKYTIQAGQFYNGEDYQVQQVVVPDRNGRWPNNPKCDAAFRIPVLIRSGGQET